MQIYLYSLLYFVLLAADVTYDSERPDLVAFAFDGFDPGINRLIGEGDATEKILQRFGQPRTVKTRTEPDGREPGVVREVETWRYDGLEIIMFGDVDRPERWLKQITLTSPSYELKLGLSIGSAKEAFIERLGPPNPWRSKPNVFEYPTGYYGAEGSVAVGSSLSVYIYFDKRNQAEKIVWRYGAL